MIEQNNLHFFSIVAMEWNVSSFGKKRKTKRRKIENEINPMSRLWYNFGCERVK